MLYFVILYVVKIFLLNKNYQLKEREFYENSRRLDRL